MENRIGPASRHMLKEEDSLDGVAQQLGESESASANQK